MRPRSAIAATAATLAVLLALGPSATAADNIVLEEKTFTREKTAERFSGAVDSLALEIRIDTVAPDGLTIAKGASTATYDRAEEQIAAPAVASDLFIACDNAEAVTVAETRSCLSRPVLSDRGLQLGEADIVGVDQLVSNGLAQIQPIRETSDVSNQGANSDVTAFLIPNVASESTSCGPDNPSSSATGLALPEPLAAIVTGGLASVSCEANVQGFPSVKHSSDELALAITLTQTLVDNLPQLNETLDSVQAQLDTLGGSNETVGQVNNAIDEIQADLSSHPLATVNVAPNTAEVLSDAAGMVAEADAQAVKIVVLDGLIEISIATADTLAQVVDGTPTSEAGASNIHVKALNILTPDPEDTLIDQEIDLGDSPVTILKGTPLESTISLLSTSTTPTECKQVGTEKACTASATGEAFSVDLFTTSSGEAAGLLPRIGFELASAGSTVEARFTTANFTPALPLARTGAAVPVTMIAGSGLLLGAAVLRRRFVS